MFKCKMVQRKPFPIYDVEYEGKFWNIIKSEDEGVRHKRWMAVQDNGGADVSYHSSKRAALHFIKTGEKFETKPVYAFRAGKQGKRIR